MKFNVSDFIKKRIRGIPVSVEEDASFEPYLCLVALEREPKLDEILVMVNTERFFRLPKKQQAHSFDFLRGMSVCMRYNPARGKRVASLKEEISAYMKEFSLDYHTAKAIVLGKTLLCQPSDV